MRLAILFFQKKRDTKETMHSQSYYRLSKIFFSPLLSASVGAASISIVVVGAAIIIGIVVASVRVGVCSGERKNYHLVHKRIRNWNDSLHFHTRPSLPNLSMYLQW